MNSTFANNTAASAGGVLISGGSVVVTNDIFMGNSAIGTEGYNQDGNGGALFAINTVNVTISSTIFNNNTASGGMGSAVRKQSDSKIFSAFDFFLLSF